MDTTVKLLFFSMRNFSDTSAASQLQHGRAIVGYEQRVDDEAEGLVVYDLGVGKKLGRYCILEACDAQYGLCSSHKRVVMGADAVQSYVLGYEPFRQAGVPCPFEQRAVGAEQVKGRKIAWVSPRSEANALQQLAGIEFMFRAQPERAAEALHQLAEPPDNICVFDVPEQLEDNGGIAHRPGLYALCQPGAAAAWHRL